MPEFALMLNLHGSNGISLIEPIRPSSCNYRRGQSVYVMGSGGTKPSGSYKGKRCIRVRRKSFLKNYWITISTIAKGTLL